MAAGSIIVDLLMRTGSFTTDTKRAEKALRELKKEAEQIGKVIGAAFGATAIASVALVQSAINTMDAMSKLAQQTGTTVEELSALAYAADLSGVSQEQLGGALVKLSKNMSDAANGSGEAAKGFAALGISVKNADGSLKSSNQVLEEVADRFAGFKDGAEKTALAVNLFGKSGAQLIPLLNGGSAGLRTMTDEARALGLVLDTETSKSAERFNDNLTRMGGVIKGIANQAAGELLPALNDASDAFLDMARSEAFIEAASLVVQGAVGVLITIFQALTVAAAEVGFVFLSVGREIGAWAAQIASLGRGDLAGFRAISDAVKADGERARAELDKFTARILAIGDAKASDRGTGDFSRLDRQTPLRDAPRITDTGPNKVSEAQRYLETLQKQLDKTGELSVEEQTLAQIRRGSIEGLTPALEKQILATAREIDGLKAAADQKKKNEEAERELMKVREAASAHSQRLQDAALREVEALIEGNAALRDEIALIGKDAEARAAIEQARLSSAIALKEETLAMLENAEASESDIKALRQQIELLKERQDLIGKRGLTEKLADEAKRSEEVAKRARENIQDHLGDGLYDAMDGNFKNIGDSFQRTIKRMVADALAADLMNAIFKQSGASGGGSTLSAYAKLIAGVFGGGGSGGALYGAGNTFGDAFLATGTNYVPYDGMRAVLHEGEAVIPKEYNPAAGGAMASGSSVNVVVNAPPGTQVERQETRTTSMGREVELWLSERISSGQSPINAALKSRGVNTSANLPRRA